MAGGKSRWAQLGWLCLAAVLGPALNFALWRERRIVATRRRLARAFRACAERGGTAPPPVRGQGQRP